MPITPVMPLTAKSPDATNDDAPGGDTVAGGANAEGWAAPVEVFSYTATEDADKTYVVLTDTRTNETTGVTTVIYSDAVIHHALFLRDAGDIARTPP